MKVKECLRNFKRTKERWYAGKKIILARQNNQVKAAVKGLVIGGVVYAVLLGIRLITPSDTFFASVMMKFVATTR